MCPWCSARGLFFFKFSSELGVRPWNAFASVRIFQTASRLRVGFSNKIRAFLLLCHRPLRRQFYFALFSRPWFTVIFASVFSPLIIGTELGSKHIRPVIYGISFLKILKIIFYWNYLFWSFFKIEINFLDFF